jgi:hypothetical protein
MTAKIITEMALHFNNPANRELKNPGVEYQTPRPGQFIYGFGCDRMKPKQKQEDRNDRAG